MHDDSPSRDRAQGRAEQRKSRRAETAESVLEDVERHLGDLEYPVTSEGVAMNHDPAYRRAGPRL